MIHALVAGLLLIFSPSSRRAPLLILLAALMVVQVRAQEDCGLANTISYPVDTSQFRLVQDFAALSTRHQGRYHTGEDWAATRGTSYGQPVRAAAAGRVTYSSERGWGRDGGVVIIEHRFASGDIAYTQYGHILPTATMPFPPRLSCVQAGQVIGTIGDARPAPHLHFEVRSGSPDTPGPGYSRELPQTLNWLDPGRFISNQQAWLHQAHAWHVVLSDGQRGPIAPPLMLADQSLMILTDNFLRRVTPDGRILWRYTLEGPAVSITGHQGSPLLTYADGTMQRMSLDGAPGESWQVAASFAGAPFTLGDALVYPASGGGLVAIDNTRRIILWQQADAEPFLRAHVTGVDNVALIALLSPDNRMRVYDADGAPIDDKSLRGPASFITGPEGGLFAYTRGGFWRIGADGLWSLAMVSAPSMQPAGAALRAEGRLILFDGERMQVYNQDDSLLWELPVNGVTGLSELDLIGGRLLLTSTGGDIAAISTEGRLCAQLRVYSEPGARVWSDLGPDNLLRVAVADQVLALDWFRLTQAC